MWGKSISELREIKVRGARARARACACTRCAASLLAACTHTCRRPLTCIWQAPAYVRWSTVMQEGTFFSFIGKADDNPKMQIALKELKKKCAAPRLPPGRPRAPRTAPRAPRAHAHMLWPCARQFRRSGDDETRLHGGGLQRSALLPLVHRPGVSLHLHLPVDRPLTASPRRYRWWYWWCSDHARGAFPRLLTPPVANCRPILSQDLLKSSMETHLPKYWTESMLARGYEVRPR